MPVGTGVVRGLSGHEKLTALVYAKWNNYALLGSLFLQLHLHCLLLDFPGSNIRQQFVIEEQDPYPHSPLLKHEFMTLFFQLFSQSCKLSIQWIQGNAIFCRSVSFE